MAVTQHLGERALVLAREHDLLRHRGGGGFLPGDLVVGRGLVFVSSRGGFGLNRLHPSRGCSAPLLHRGGLLSGGGLDPRLLDSQRSGLLGGGRPRPRLLDSDGALLKRKIGRRRPRPRLLDSDGLFRGGGLDRLLDDGLLRDDVVRLDRLRSRPARPRAPRRRPVPRRRPAPRSPAPRSVRCRRSDRARSRVRPASPRRATPCCRQVEP